jgi:periplasmic protein TonB
MKPFFLLVFLISGPLAGQTEHTPSNTQKSHQTEYGEIFLLPDVPAEFPGGKKSLSKFLSKNITYPQTAVEHEIAGKCYLQFVVSASGNISNVTVQRGVPDCPECDTEVVRVVRLMPKWIPATVDGKNVHSIVNFPFGFKLD